MRYYLLALAISAAVSFVMSVIAWRFGLKYKIYPKIRERDVHKTPTPRLGGVAMWAGVVVALLSAWFVFPLISDVDYFRLVFADPGPPLAIMGAATVIVIIGVVDDLYDLDWMTKLAGQIIAAGVLAWQGVQLVSLPLGGSLAIGSPYMSLILTILAVVLVMNAVNFIDGLDGLVAGVAIVANGVFFVYSFVISITINQTEYFNLAALLSAVLIGACLGFLPLNWHPARLFMGDAGALLTGLLMATSAISVTGQIDPAQISRTALLPAFIPILLPFAILIVPLLDFGLAVLRRVSAGKSPFTADRKHLHHRLLDMGHSHFQAVLIFYAWTIVVAVGCLMFLFVKPTYFVLIFLGVGLVACAAVTLAPLSRRKRVEIAVQATSPDQLQASESGRFDPLDEAASALDPADTDTAAQAAVPELTPPKERP
ncbi:MraY family glycosyltransferase [Frigoribacterium faeni]|uniref:UDP-GlcNAc:undecaprenyl-phosphate GlcNAc-1-phosphate transferase n=1 Tax=Frigoribacterium faeni TaxID=145483 RepID=A0A7W3JGT9_9MICO|nr:MraY family glycosyltransferase [Frigoribacterium faeni]MBA8812553.1 UDP-GlcNAc:undecaprenyl-phosphate GlcNAc-1-phosphate transferase [Frigoribacterium faeni]GEK81729.1 undecaprenyl-phosphate alpha-N-acetylglucosaminyl 1-phosphate transferase [Frigoribacterium faeni]